MVSSIPHGQRAVPSATAASLRVRRLRDFRRRGRCVHTVNADVPVDSLPVWDERIDKRTRPPRAGTWSCNE